MPRPFRTSPEDPTKLIRFEHAWSKVANMLYLEAPAGSFLTPVDEHSGFSYCTKGGVKQAKCAKSAMRPVRVIMGATSVCLGAI